MTPSRGRGGLHLPSIDETLLEWLRKPKSFRAALLDLPILNPTGLRDCQIKAISNWKPHSRRTVPAPSCKWRPGQARPSPRLRRSTGCSNMPALVGSSSSWTTRNLGEQAEQEFMAYVPNDDSRKFTELYTVQRLNSSSFRPTRRSSSPRSSGCIRS